MPGGGVSHPAAVKEPAVLDQAIMGCAGRTLMCLQLQQPFLIAANSFVPRRMHAQWDVYGRW